MRDWTSLQNNNDYLYMLLHSRISIFVSLSKEIYFWKTMKLLLTFSGAEKEAKRHFYQDKS
jgi:hypothetical protein